MKVKPVFIFFCAVCVGWSSCRKSEQCENRNGNYGHGVFVVNEGPFGGTGSITWYDPLTGEVVQDVYEAENCGASLGQFVQSMQIFNGKAYIIVNGANRIVIVDANTFKYLGTIEGFAQPRYLLPINNHFAYVSQWGSDGLSGSIAKVDLVAKRIVQTIAVGSGPEKMLPAGDRVWVANSGGYGQDSTIVEINTLTDEIAARYVTSGKNPASLIWYKGAAPEELVYLCKGYYLAQPVTGNLNSLQNGTPQGVTVGAFADDLVAGKNGDMYFAGTNYVYQVIEEAGAFSVTPFIEQPSYGFGLDTAENKFYCADAKDFSAAGTVYIRNMAGAVERSFPAGVAPGEIIFNR